MCEEDTPILDACCGSKMFWFDKDNPDVMFMDNRKVNAELSDGRKLVVMPDTIGDFRDMPFNDNSFYMVVFDPPHLINAGENRYKNKEIAAAMHKELFYIEDIIRQNNRIGKKLYREDDEWQRSNAKRNKHRNEVLSNGKS